MIRFGLTYCSIIVLATSLSLTAADSKSNSEQKPKPAKPAFRWVNQGPDKLPSGVEHRTFRSPSMGINVGYCIYLPKQYVHRPKARFPVVYYLHGGRPGNEFKSVSLARFVDEAITDGRLPPTLYVFVNGGPVSHYNYPEKDHAMGEDIFIRELIPHIDATFRTVANRSGRGLEGFSQGGRGTMRISLKYPELFCSVAAGGGGYATEKRISEEKGKESETLVFAEGYNTWDLAQSYTESPSPPLQLMVYVGDQGFNYQCNLEYMDFLKDLGISHQRLIVSEATHSAKMIYEKAGDEILRFHAQNLH